MNAREGYNPIVSGNTLKLTYPGRNAPAIDVNTIIQNNKHRNIKQLNLQYFQVSKIRDAKKILTEIPTIIGVHFESIYFHRLDEINDKLFLLAHIIEMIEINRLEEFSINNLQYYDEDVLLLSNAIKNCSSLKKCHIGFNYWDRSGEKNKIVDKFNTMYFHSDSKLTELNFKNCQLSENSIKHLMKQLELNKSVKHANFINCGLNDRSCIYLANTLKENTHIKDLLLDNNKIRDEGIIVLSSFLKHNSTLRNFSINENYMRDSFIIFIGNLVKKQDSSIEILRIGNNDIGSMSIKALSMSLNSIPNITELDLEGTKFNESSMSRFLLVMSSNKTIRNLSLKSTFLNSSIERKAAKMLLVNKRLELFGIGNNKSTVERDRWNEKCPFFNSNRIFDTLHYNSKLNYVDVGYIKATSVIVKKALKAVFIHEIGKDNTKTICLNKCKIHSLETKNLYAKFKRTKQYGFVEIPQFAGLARNNHFW